ncbi:hypothetical protein BGX26_006679, partial [Mortierella sp. AD094]
MGRTLPVDLADSSPVDVVDSPLADVVDSLPVRVIDSQELARYFAQRCYADAWIVASNAELSFTWRDLKDVYSKNLQELEKYSAVSGIVSMRFGHGWGDEFHFEVRDGIIESHLIGYQIVKGVDHKGAGIDAYLGVSENFMKFCGDFTHSPLYSVIVSDPFKSDERLIGVIHKCLVSLHNDIWIVVV